MALGTAELIGLGGSALTSYFGYKSQKKYLDWLKKFYAPEMEAKKAALPAIRNLVLGYYLPQVGKQSELLKSQHLLNLAGLGRQEAAGLRTSQRHWSLLGNTGRGRGEQLRLRLSAEQARNAENLGYGKSQEEYLSGKAAQALSSLQMLATLGQAGNSFAGDFAQMGMKSGSDFWTQMGLFFDDLSKKWPAGKKDTSAGTTGGAKDRVKKEGEP